MVVNLAELKKREIAKSTRVLKNQCLRNESVKPVWLELVKIIEELRGLKVRRKDLRARNEMALMGCRDKEIEDLNTKACDCFDRLRDCCKSHSIEVGVESHNDLCSSSISLVM